MLSLLIHYSITDRFESFFVTQTLIGAANMAIWKSSWIMNKLSPAAVKSAWITFYMEAYIELLIGCIISF